MELAFIFPGQGSQSLKMMDGLLECKEVCDVFAQATAVLQQDFLAMLQEETPDNINNTVNTQPLLLTADIATYNAWCAFGGQKPQVVAGHSLGEWSALVVSGVLEFTDALRLVRLRAELMQDAVPVGQGAMAAVLGLDDEAVTRVCEEVAQKNGGVVAGVNFNSPGQVVIAGSTDCVAIASAALKEAGARKVQTLPVSVPSHCSFMQCASEKLAQGLANIEFKLPQIKLLHNYDAKSYNDLELIKQALIKQLYMPVLWSKTISEIAASGIINIVECGPGKVLSGLNKRINPEIKSYNLHNLVDFNHLKEHING